MASLKFTFNGREIRAEPGDTIASALAKAGILELGRSLKLGKPRGVFCCSGYCFRCLVTVDGVPNVRACITPVRDGMVVTSQGGSRLRAALIQMLDKVGFTSPQFYFEKLHLPFTAAAAATELFRRAVSGAELPPPAGCELKAGSCEVDAVVVGGGAAGLAAARVLAEAGLSVVLLEEKPEPGGMLAKVGFIQELGCSGGKLADEMVKEAVQAGAEVKRGMLAYAVEGNVLYAVSEAEAVKFKFRGLILATGVHELPRAFEGNYLPGVVNVDGFMTIVNRWGIKSFSSVALLPPPAEGRSWHLLAEKVAQEAGIEAVKVPEGSAAVGRGRVTGVRTPSGELIKVDLLVAPGRLVPALELAKLLGFRGGELSGGACEIRSRVYVAGLAAGAGSVLDALRGGEEAGKLLAEELGA
ncbi:MAG: hypothetical protein DRN99_03745 [Thermoproteota archaeon]|nr:MAG: hypothetical protein DRN99_03745 [Candidatus Korarchaeota archaeon]